MTDTVGWYDANAEDFFRRTFSVGLLPQLRDLAQRLPPGARVLEVGCGAGRDAKILRDLGFAVSATEASPKLAALARAYSGVDVTVMTFDEMAWPEDSFDAIWACASLLHAPRAELPDLLRRLTHSLAPGGHFFMSFKYGSDERTANGRRFTDLDEVGAQRLLAEAGGLELLNREVTADGRPERAHERWLNLLCRRIP